jgi:predicted RNase H-like HicB family nuclease
MRSYTALIERCPDTSLFVGYVPGFPGAHSQGATLEEVQQNLTEVISMLLEDGDEPPEGGVPAPQSPVPQFGANFVCTRDFEVA